MLSMSIGMPVYNGEKFICEALDSLLSQTFTEFELVISDNASTDNTQMICEDYARRDQRIRYIRQDGNMGAIANFQFVLEESKGNFFMWAAADDRWDKHWIASIYSHIYDNQGLAGFGRLTHIDASGEPMSHLANDANLQFVGSKLWRKMAFYLAYEGLGKANPFYAIYPREQLLKMDFLNARFDYHMLFNLINHVAFVQIGSAYLYKRIHNESGGATPMGIQQNSSMFFSMLKVFRQDFQIATHYLRGAKSGLKIILFFLIPIKLLLALKLHVRRVFFVLCNKVSI